MSQLPFEQLQLKRGVIQELTAQDHDSGLMLHVRWKGGLTLQLSYRWEYYWITIQKDDTIFQSLRVDREKYVMEKLQKAISSIDERGNFARQKSTAELVAAIVQERQLTSCMNNTKWDKFRNAMIEEMPFCPPYEIKTLFDEDDTAIQNFIKWDANYRGAYDEESFAGFHYKIIEYVAVKTRYCDVTGGRLVSSKTWHGATKEFTGLMEKYHIPYVPYEDSGDTFLIYGYQSYMSMKKG